MQIAKKTAPSRKRNNKGFSLIELIIVITIMAILTALLAPQLLRYVEQSRVAKDAVTLDEVERAISLALTDETAYAAIGDGATVKYSNSGSVGAIAYAGTGNAALKAEMEKTLGTSYPALVSSTYKSATITFTINISASGVLSVTRT